MRLYRITSGPVHEAVIGYPAFIWLDTAPEKLSATALQACLELENSLYLSVVSAWEILIKQRLGKLKLDVALETMIDVQQEANQLQILSTSLEHVLAVQDLPLHHNDPFDRLLIAQAKVEKARLVTADGQIEQYADQVGVLW